MSGRREVTKFTLTAEHVALLRRANVQWDYAEVGAPCIDPKRPYGNSDHLRDIAELLWPEDTKAALDEYGTIGRALTEAAHRVHEQTETALAVVLSAGSFEPGVYVRTTPYSHVWRPAPSETTGGGA